MPKERNTPGPLVTEPLDWTHCLHIAKTMNGEDAHECSAMGSTPLQSLATGAMMGFSRSVLRRATGTAVGAFGCNPLYHTIWSLWCPMGLREQRQVLQETPKWVEDMVRRCGDHRPLHNFVEVANTRTIRWLDAAGCFVFPDEAAAVLIGGHPHLFFQTKAPIRHV